MVLRASSTIEVPLGRHDQGCQSKPLLRRSSERLHAPIAGERMCDALRRVPAAASEVDAGADALLAVGPHMHRRELHRQGGSTKNRRGAWIGDRCAGYESA